MSIGLGWDDIAVRLILTVLAGILIGINRGEHGSPAGLRTTVLVCLAASLAMIQTNLLLGTAGKSTDSFVTLDLMRLPLGILSGMGFLGGGVILKRGNMVVGLTTAATLWFVTVMGLCFGGGQLLLGLTALGLGIAVLWTFKWIELWLPHDHLGTLILTSVTPCPSEVDVCRMIRSAGFQILSQGVVIERNEQRRTLTCELRWRATMIEADQPVFLKELEQLQGVARLRWSPQGMRAG
jgi:putative Mg2+ transporter-C (MgtC) family protein